MKMNPYRGRGRGGFWLGLIRDWGVALIVALILFAAGSYLFSNGPAVRDGEAPDFTLPDLAGEEVELAALRGQPVVLNFWATWCGPCKAEMPELVAWVDANEEVPLYGISVDRGMPVKRLQRFVDSRSLNYPVLHDSRGSVADDWGVHTLPTTVVVTADGHIGGHHVGMIDRDELQTLVDKAATHTH